MNAIIIATEHWRGHDGGWWFPLFPHPDGYRIELVLQWPPGHADGRSDADFA